MKYYYKKENNSTNLWASEAINAIQKLHVNWKDSDQR